MSVLCRVKRKREPDTGPVGNLSHIRRASHTRWPCARMAGSNPRDSLSWRNGRCTYPVPLRNQFGYYYWPSINSNCKPARHDKPREGKYTHVVEPGHSAGYSTSNSSGYRFCVNTRMQIQKELPTSHHNLPTHVIHYNMASLTSYPSRPGHWIPLWIGLNITPFLLTPGAPSAMSRVWEQVHLYTH